MGQNPGKFYNRVSFFYPLIDFFLKRQKRKLFSEINNFPAGKLLEIGVGKGKYLHLYKSHQITGIDSSTAMLHASRKNNFPGVELLEMNGEGLLFPASQFDYIVLSHVIAVVNDPEQLMEEAYRVLKPGGKIIILNHFTPGNWLKYADRAFRPLSGYFHFKSLFYPEDIKTLKKFILQKEMVIGHFAYFKLLIFSKIEKV